MCIVGTTIIYIWLIHELYKGTWKCHFRFIYIYGALDSRQTYLCKKENISTLCDVCLG